MSNIIELLRLKYQGELTHEQIARAVGLSKGAVAKYVALARAAGIASWPLPEGVDEEALERRLFARCNDKPSRYIEPDWFEVHQQMKRKGVTLMLLWSEHVDAVGERAHRYTQFSMRYRAWKQRQKRSMRQCHRAGEKCFIDYAGQTVPIISSKTGEIREAQIFVAVLGASSYAYAEASWSQGLEDWISSNRRMLEYFASVPELLVPDNLKSAVTTASRYEPLLNRSYLEFARHYGTAVLPTRPRKPKDKAKVEAGVLLVERWILAALRHREFFSLAELNRAIAELLERLNDRLFQGREVSRRMLFEQLDRPAMKPLPERRYEFAVWKHARVGPDYHVQYEQAYFSVPHSLVGASVELCVTPRLLEVVQRGKRVAVHERVPGQRYHTIREHMPLAHQRHAEWTPQRFLEWGERIGPATARIVHHQLENRPHPEHGYRSCLGLLSLSRQYSRERLEQAARLALLTGTHSVKSVRSILNKGLDTLEQPELHDNLAELPTHENVRGADYFH